MRRLLITVVAMLALVSATAMSTPAAPSSAMLIRAGLA